MRHIFQCLLVVALPIVVCDAMAQTYSGTVPEARPVLPKASELPTRWKSLQSGNIFILRGLSDRIIVERQIPDEERQYGERTLGELTQRGASTFSGNVNVTNYCVSPSVAQLCPYSTAFSLNVISPDRIELTVNGPSQFNCQSCEILNSSTTTASWIPALPQDRPSLRLASQIQSARGAAAYNRQQKESACNAAIATMRETCANPNNPFLCGMNQATAQAACQ